MVSVIVCAGLVVPMIWLAKLSVDGESEGTAVEPFPDIGTT